MTNEKFDQTPDAVWRALAKRRDFAGATRAIEEYLSAGSGWVRWQEVTLLFHAA